MLNYNVHGCGDKVIIMLHGLSQTHKAFDEQLELADEYKLITLDLRGHGNSTLEGEITIEQMVADVIELMDHLHIEQTVLLGVSLGGLVCQEIYKQHPNRVKALILSNTYSYVPDVFLKMEIENRKNRLDCMSDDEYTEAIAKKCSLSQKYDILNKIKQTINVKRDTYVECASAPIGHDYRDVVRGIDKPVLICSGLFDIITPVFLQYLQYFVVRNATHRVFHSGHLPNIECAAEFNDEVRKFLDGIYG